MTAGKVMVADRKAAADMMQIADEAGHLASILKQPIMQLARRIQTLP
jgi:hypothetical protein